MHVWDHLKIKNEMASIQFTYKFKTALLNQIEKSLTQKNKPVIYKLLLDISSQYLTKSTINNPPLLIDNSDFKDNLKLTYFSEDDILQKLEIIINNF